MAKKSTKIKTTRSQLRSALRRLFLRSPERAAALKRDKYTCRKCGAKQSKRKGHEVGVQVHHKSGIDNWSEVEEVVFSKLLCYHGDLETLCEECHKKEDHN